MCELRVRVIYQADGAPLGVAFTELTVHLLDTPQIRSEHRTDEQGAAEFIFAGGSGSTVIAQTATGATGSAVLDRAAQVELTIVVKPNALAIGTVIGPDHHGVADADIVLLPWQRDDHHPLDVWRIGRSGQDGSFRIPIEGGGRIGATHPDYVSSALFKLRPAPNDGLRAATLRFTLRLRGDAPDIRGTVRDANGRAVADALIELRTLTQIPGGAEMAGPPLRVYSDARGHFRAASLPVGEALWSARKVGHGWDHGTTTLAQDNTTPIEIVLPGSSRLTGTVVDQSSGQPVQGATVTAGVPGTICNRTTTSRADGTYTLDHLGSGPTKVAATFEQRSATTTVELFAGAASIWSAELQGDYQATLRGLLVDPRNAPLANWTIIVRHADDTPASGRTDERGAFVIPLRQARDLDVRAFAPGRPPTAFADLTRRGVSAEDPIRLTAQSEETTAVSGRCLGSDASGIAATIGCWHHERREYARFQADQSGFFEIQCPTGTVDLTIEHTAHVAHRIRNKPLQSGLRADLGMITLALGGGLFGNVMTPAGPPPAACELRLLAADGTQRVAEYSGGAYRFTAAPPGSHTLVVQGEGLAGASFPLTITAGVDLPRDIEVQQGLRRLVHVSVPPGGGSRVTFAIRGSDSRTRWYASNVVLRPSPSQAGTCLFETWMAAGEYEVIAVTPEGYEGRATAHYQSGTEAPLIVPLAPR